MHASNRLSLVPWFCALATAIIMLSVPHPTHVGFIQVDTIPISNYLNEFSNVEVSSSNPDVNTLLNFIKSEQMWTEEIAPLLIERTTSPPSHIRNKTLFIGRSDFIYRGVSLSGIEVRYQTTDTPEFTLIFDSIYEAFTAFWAKDFLQSFAEMEGSYLLKLAKFEEEKAQILAKEDPDSMERIAQIDTIAEAIRNKIESEKNRLIAYPNGQLIFQPVVPSNEMAIVGN